MADLSIENVSMTFQLPGGGAVEALKDINLDLKQGEILSVLGPSGCGKTTLLNILAGFLAATAGRVILGDHEIHGPDPERGMVFQQGALFEWMSVRRNIAFGPDMKGAPKAETNARVDQLLDTVGLQDFGDKMIYELSGGMQQRVALARCLANEPDVILMDEPLGALDALTREKMQGLVLKLWKETGKTIILITHSVEEALLLGERLLVMAPRPGRIHKEYALPFAELGVGADLREVKKHDDFGPKREEILTMIWDMEEEIMGRTEGLTMDIRNALGLRQSSFVERKTVTFGDESAVTANRLASILSVVAIFVVWGVFTGSRLVPVHVPAPFVGETGFTYTVADESGETQTARVTVVVTPRGEKPPAKPEPVPLSGLAADDFQVTNVRIGASVPVLRNDLDKGKGLTITEVNGQPIEKRQELAVDNGTVVLTPGNTLLFKPYLGWQTDPIYLPPPEAVVQRFFEIWNAGYRNSTLGEHVGYSLFRVFAGFLAGSIVGIPLGFAMGLNGWVRGWFDPIVEFMRPVPPLALIPLVIIWAGIGETAKIILLFLAALWIMAIAARAGVSGVKIQKVHAAYSLGASKWQILTRVILPNALPEIFTGARVAMGVCWGTVVAAELVAAEKGSGMMIMVASKFQLTDIVIMGIIVIGVIGYTIDILMRRLENWLIPWKGRG